METSKIPTTVRKVRGWYEKSVVRTVWKIQRWYEKSMVRKVRHSEQTGSCAGPQKAKYCPQIFV